MLSLPPNVLDSQTSSLVLNINILTHVCNYLLATFICITPYTPKISRFNQTLLESVFSNPNPLPELTFREWHSHHPAICKRDIALKYFLPHFTLPTLLTCLSLNVFPCHHVQCLFYILRCPFPSAKWHLLLIARFFFCLCFPQIISFHTTVGVLFKKFKPSYVPPLFKTIACLLIIIWIKKSLKRSAKPFKISPLPWALQPHFKLQTSFFLSSRLIPVLFQFFE